MIRMTSFWNAQSIDPNGLFFISIGGTLEEQRAHSNPLWRTTDKNLKNKTNQYYKNISNINFVMKDKRKESEQGHTHMTD